MSSGRVNVPARGPHSARVCSTGWVACVVLTSWASAVPLGGGATARARRGRGAEWTDCVDRARQDGARREAQQQPEPFIPSITMAVPCLVVAGGFSSTYQRLRDVDCLPLVRTTDSCCHSVAPVDPSSCHFLFGVSVESNRCTQSTGQSEIAVNETV